MITQQVLAVADILLQLSDALTLSFLGLAGDVS
jgi:hypothetical protein